VDTDTYDMSRPNVIQFVLHFYPDTDVWILIMILIQRRGIAILKYV